MKAYIYDVIITYMNVFLEIYATFQGKTPDFLWKAYRNISYRFTSFRKIHMKPELEDQQRTTCFVIAHRHMSPSTTQQKKTESQANVTCVQMLTRIKVFGVGGILVSWES